MRPVAVVTGGGRGLGRGIALALADAGHDLVLGWRSGEAAVHETVAAVETRGARALSAQGDVADPDTAKALVAAADELGGPHVWVNNAGISLIAPVLDTSGDTMTRMFEVNVLGTLFGLQAAATAMRESSTRGRIVNVASDAGLQGFAMLGGYAATKFAVVGLTQTAALELAPSGITVNAVCPGTAETDMNQAEWTVQSKLTGDAEGDVRSEYLADIPLGRFVTPDDVGATVAWLASPGARSVTGQSVCVNGGTVLH